MAELIRDGYIRVVLPTTFDPLLEKALEDAGVHPAIVSDISGITGMMPVQHEPVTIVKLHGHHLEPPPGSPSAVLIGPRVRLLA